MGTIEEIANASEIAVEEVMAHVKEILGDSYRFEGIHVQVSNKEGRMMNFTMNDERVKDILFVLSKQVLSLTSNLLQEDPREVKATKSKPEWGPSPIPQIALNTQMLNVLEKKIMAKVEEKITAAVVQIQMGNSQSLKVDPKDYNKHLFGRTP